MSEKRLFREYKQLQQTPASTQNPQILDLAPLDAEESIHVWKAVICKRSKHDLLFYYNGKWTLEIDAGEHYPKKPPKISFSAATRINHPNINFETGEICLDILKDDAWLPAWNLQHLVGAILTLLDEPEPDSPLNVDLANLFRSDKLAFESAVQHTMWRENTLLNGPKDDSGVKTDETNQASETVQNLDESGEKGDPNRFVNDENDAGNSLEESLGDKSTQEPQVDPKNTPSHTFIYANGVLTSPAAKTDHELDYIHDLGRHITQEFLKKATEVQIASPRTLEHLFLSSHQLAAVHQHVSNNVARQIEQICLKTGSRAQSPTEDLLARPGDVSSAQLSFMEKIDQQVDEIRRMQERQSLE